MYAATEEYADSPSEARQDAQSSHAGYNNYEVDLRDELLHDDDLDYGWDDGA